MLTIQVTFSDSDCARATAEEIKRYLTQLNEELRSMDVKGEICLYGGAVMALAYNARPDTKDVDAIFQPAAKIREAAAKVARAHELRPDWLNDAVKGFLVPHKQRMFLDLSNLKVFVPEPDYLLAMKAISARHDTMDAADLRLLVDLL